MNLLILKLIVSSLLKNTKVLKEKVKMEVYNRTDEKHIVYHYCSVDTFLNIIKYKKLWLSDSHYMNDSTEGIWIDKLVKETITEFIKDNPKNKTQLDALEVAYNKLGHSKHYFISFSKDGDVLSQWRAYADDGYGVAIGFQSGLFYDIAKITRQCNNASQNKGEIAKSDIFKFSYMDINYNNSIRDTIKDTINNYLNNEEITKSDIYALLLKNDAISVKHSSFQEENELRIVYTPTIPYQENEKNKHLDAGVKKLSEKKYRTSNNQIIPYYEFDFNATYNSLLIPKIILAPKSKLKEDDIKEFLESNGFKNTKIQKSKSPYI